MKRRGFIQLAFGALAARWLPAKPPPVDIVKDGAVVGYMTHRAESILAPLLGQYRGVRIIAPKEFFLTHDAIYVRDSED